MPKIEFRSNKSVSVGVEVELQLIDPLTGNLKPVAPNILKSLKDTECGSVQIKAELFQSMLELDTPICRDAHEAGESLRSSLEIVRMLAKKNDAQVLMSGTHPFARYTERLLTPEGRYFSLVDRNKWIARRLQIFGLHIHLGMRNGEHAIAMNNALCHYLPIILAISASSPYWQRDDTGLASSRITFFEAVPTGGHPYNLNSWTEFESLVGCLIKSKSIMSMKDLWWDIRPNAEYGTIEVRIADCPPTMKEVEAVVAFVHALAVFVDSELERGRIFAPPPEWILRENKWRASRHGVNCDLITSPQGDTAPFLEVWEKTCFSLRDSIVKFDYQEKIDFLRSVISMGPSYSRQRQHNTGDLISVVQHLIRENENNFPEWTCPNE